MIVKAVSIRFSLKSSADSNANFTRGAINRDLLRAAEAAVDEAQTSAGVETLQFGDLNGVFDEKSF